MGNLTDLEYSEMQKNIENVLIKNLPKDAFKYVALRNNFFGGKYFRIGFAASEVNINRVAGQHPQLVSLSFDPISLELETQIYGGSGGQSIYRELDKDNPKERFYAMKRVKVPFRKPKKEMKFVYSALERFCLNWVKSLKDNRDVLMYQDIVDYDSLLS